MTATTDERACAKCRAQKLFTFEQQHDLLEMAFRSCEEERIELRADIMTHGEMNAFDLVARYSRSEGMATGTLRGVLAWFRGVCPQCALDELDALAKVPG